MQMNDYQEWAATTARFPEGVGLLYLGLKLSGEAGEVTEKIGKAVRNGTIIVEPVTVDGASGRLATGEVRTIIDDPHSLLGRQIIKELGDVLWYVAMTARELGYTLEEVADVNIDKLTKRVADGTIVGAGDDR